MQTKKRVLTTTEINLLLRNNVDPFKLDLTIHGEKPIEYIIGMAVFKNLDFIVNRHVLIPRPESEMMVDLALSFVQKKRLSKLKFIDIGTGSGCIGITFQSALIKQKISSHGILTDLSKKALQVAKQNITHILGAYVENSGLYSVFNHQLQSKFILESESTYSDLIVKRSDLLENISSKEKFDIIFANLPYIPSARIKKLQSSVKDFEPISALDGGEDGLFLIRKLLDQAYTLVKKTSLMMLEVDDTHTQEKTQEFLQAWNIDVITDENDKVRFWKCRKK